MNDPSGVPHFLIVGTPRSGTTVIQRLACELPGVRVPIETHFFSKFLPVLRRCTFPLTDEALRTVLQVYASIDSMRGAALDVQGLFSRLRGRANGPLEMFRAVIRELSGSGAEILGEKTPEHLRWWRPLTTCLPALKVILVVRDPRAVVSSSLAMPWAPRPGEYAKFAELWKLDQGVASEASDRLGSRALLLYYERVVLDPEGARARIAGFLGVDQPDRIETPRPDDMFLAWETWKAAVTNEITQSRIDAWRRTLTVDQARGIAAICRREMTQLGYECSLGPLGAMAVRFALGPRMNAVRRGMARRYRRSLARISETRFC